MFTFNRLQQQNALIIANGWKYEEPYSFYDMTADQEDYDEFVNETIRNDGEYFEAICNNELVGFFVLEIEDDEIEIGLGLRPDFCGKGTGREFLNSIIKYVDENHSYRRLILSVAAFNERAIKVYETCGFKQQTNYIQETNGGKYEFIKMIKDRL